VERNFAAKAPDRLWVADITYIPTWAGFLYLAVVLDTFSRRIVGWSMATTLAKQLVLDALNMALVTRRPRDVIHHSCPATSGTDPLATLGIDPSGCVSLFGWWDRFSVPTWFPCGVARSCGQAWPQATGVAGREACLTATSTTPGSDRSG
jgi:hypothetical protein